MKTEDICTNLTTSIAQVVFRDIEMLPRLWPLKALEGGVLKAWPETLLNSTDSIFLGMYFDYAGSNKATYTLGPL